MQRDNIYIPSQVFCDDILFARKSESGVYPMSNLSRAFFFSWLKWSVVFKTAPETEKGGLALWVTGVGGSFLFYQAGAGADYNQHHLPGAGVQIFEKIYWFLLTPFQKYGQ